MTTGTTEVGNEAAWLGLSHLPNGLNESYFKEPHLCHPVIGLSRFSFNNGITVKAYLVLLLFTLLYFTDAAFFTNWKKQDPPPAKSLWLILLSYLLYCGGLEPNTQ